MAEYGRSGMCMADVVGCWVKKHKGSKGKFCDGKGVKKYIVTAKRREQILRVVNLCTEHYLQVVKSHVIVGGHSYYCPELQPRK